MRLLEHLRRQSVDGTGLRPPSQRAHRVRMEDRPALSSRMTNETGGTLVVAGNFTQSTNFSSQSFVASGTHRTVFNRGSGVQGVSFGSPVALPRAGLFESPVTSRSIDLSRDRQRLIGVLAAGQVASGSTTASEMQIVLIGWKS